MLETELEKSFAWHGNLFALLARGYGGSRASSHKRSNTCSFTSTRDAANERAQSSTTQNLLGRVAALALPLNLIVGSHQRIRSSIDNDVCELQNQFRTTLKFSR